METAKLPELPLYTYLMRTRGMLKIGRSYHPGRRSHSVGGIGAPRARILAVIPSDILSETEALGRCAEYLVQGREWFSDEPDITEYFQSFAGEFTPEPWDHVCAMFWYSDPRIPTETQQRMKGLPAIDIPKVLFAPRRRTS